MRAGALVRLLGCLVATLSAVPWIKYVVLPPRERTCSHASLSHLTPTCRSMGTCCFRTAVPCTCFARRAACATPVVSSCSLLRRALCVHVCGPPGLSGTAIGMLGASQPLEHYVNYLKCNGALWFGAKFFVAAPIVYHYIGGLRHLVRSRGALCARRLREWRGRTRGGRGVCVQPTVAK